MIEQSQDRRLVGDIRRHCLNPVPEGPTMGTQLRFRGEENWAMDDIAFILSEDGLHPLTRGIELKPY